MKNTRNIPIVIEQTKTGEKAYDIYSRLLIERTIVLGCEIDDEVSSSIVSQLLFLANADSKKDIYLYINSPGGEVTSGLAIYDTMQHIDPDINTICIGRAASMAQVLLCAGTEGKRSSLPYSRIMMHQVSSSTWGPIHDMRIHTQEAEKVNQILLEIISNHTHKTIQQIESDSSRDLWLSPQEALAYGMIDNVIQSKKKINKDMKKK